MILGFIFRISVALNGLHGSDILFHLSGAFTVLGGGLLYRDVHYVYPPLYAYLQAGVIALFGRNVLVYKFWPIVSDFLVALVLYFFFKVRGEERVGLFALVVYLFNPLTLLSSSWYGLFDSLVAFLFLYGLYLYLRGRAYGSAFALGVGVVVKVASVFVGPLMALHIYLRRGLRETVLWALMFSLPIFLVEAPYLLIVGMEALKQQLEFHIVRGGEGFSVAALFSGLHIPSNIITLVFWIAKLLIYGIVFYLMVKKPLSENIIIKGCFTIMLALITFNTFLYPHYLIYVLPLFLLNYSKTLYEAIASFIKERLLFKAEAIIPIFFIVTISLVCPAYWKFYRDSLAVTLIALMYNMASISLLVSSMKELFGNMERT